MKFIKRFFFALMLATVGIMAPDVASNAFNCSPCLVQPILVNKVIYVSSVNYNGIPVGSNSSLCGTQSSPCLTLDYALANRYLTNNEFRLNGNPSAPTTYFTSGLIAGTYKVTAVPGQEYGAILAGSTGTSNVFSMVVDANWTLGTLIVDPSLNSAGPASDCIDIPNSVVSPARMKLSLVGTMFQNWTNQCINTLGTNRSQLTVSGAIFNGGNVNGAIFYGNMSSLSGVYTTLNIDNMRCTLTAQKLAVTGGCVVAIASDIGVTAVVTNSTMSCTLDPTLTGAALHYCVRFHELANSHVSGGTYSILGAPGGRTGTPVQFTVTAKDISNSYIDNVTVTNTTNGGYGCGAGSEVDIGSPVATNVNITHCYVTGNAVSAAGTVHCIFLGEGIANSVAQYNTCNTVGLGLVIKADNTTASFNTITDPYSGGIIIKGATNAAANDNTITINSALPSVRMFDVEDSIDGTQHSLNAGLARNTFTNNAGTGIVFGSVEANNTFVPLNNIYNQLGGSTSTNVYQITTTNYTNCPTYQAAIEPTATCNGF